MRRLIHPLAGLLDRVQRRFARSRPGSVLILTVVLVVLLALLGTALLSTTRIDRYTATQNSANVQIDMLVEGVKELAKSAIASGLFGAPDTSAGGTSAYRAPSDTSAPPPANVSGAGIYHHYDSPPTLDPNGTGKQVDNDAWLASRAPELVLDAAGNPARVYWPAITKWLANSGFDAPFVVKRTGTTDAIDLTKSTAFTGQDPTNYTGNASKNNGGFIFAPTYVRPAGYSQVFPAWGFPSASPTQYYLAADADGDGIADSAFFKLPVGQIDGVTYYAAVRIVDNNSLINVNTAWSRAFDYDFTGRPVDGLGSTTFGASGFAENLGFFRGSVGLREMMFRSGVTDQSGSITIADNNNANLNAEIAAMNRYRFGYNPSTNLGTLTYVASGAMLMDPGIPPNTGTASQARSDATFLTQNDLLEHQISARLENPGYNTLSTGGDAVCRAFSPLSEAAALAYHGGIQLNLSASPSLLEGTFNDAYKLVGGNDRSPDSLYRSAANYDWSSAGATGPLLGFGRALTIAGRSSYSADQIAEWFDQNYNAYEPATLAGRQLPVPGNPSSGTFSWSRMAYRTLRPAVTTYNPVANQVQQRALPNTAPTGTGPLLGQMTDYRKTAPKTSVNTADFGELWRAFWCVMAENDSGSGTPFTPAFVPNSQRDLYNGMRYVQTYPYLPQSDAAPDDPAGTEHHLQRMFRNSIRNPQANATGSTLVYFNDKSELLLRSALAAVQTLALRQQGNTAPNPVYQQIELPAQGLASKATVTLFGNQPQPFITEVFANTDTSADINGLTNPQGYVAIELYNPYTAPIQLDDTWHLIAVKKDSAAVGYPLAGAITWDFPLSAANIASKGYAVIENMGGTATHRSPAVVASPGPQPDGSGATLIEAVPLENALDHELVLVRHVITPGSGHTPLTNPEEYQPIDSFDFTGLQIIGDSADQWHYARETDGWKCVYPGRYDAEASGPSGSAGKRQQGTNAPDAPWTTAPPANATPDPWGGTGDPNTPITLGSANPQASYPNSVFTVQLGAGDDGWPGPNKLQASGNKFPFGKFARNGDMLQIPFIGAYVIQDSTGQFVEMNSITMDAAFAEDSDQRDDEANTAVVDPQRGCEQIGRFCPLRTTDPSGSTVNIDDYDSSTAAKILTHRYAWAKRLFAYLTVQAPHDDYLPNVSPNDLAQPQPVNNDNDDTTIDGKKYPGATPETDVNGNPKNSEDIDPVQGLININTASWRVLSALPMLPAGDHWTLNDTVNPPTWNKAADGIEDTVQLAKAIVKWRDGDPVNNVLPGGPFKSLFDLYRVPAVRELQREIIRAGNPDQTQGDFTANDDGARNDFEEQYLLLNKISNLICTRSDSFTVYILVQGWRGIGTSKPEMVVQRRAAFIQDRSPVTLESKALPAAVNVPND